MQTAEGGNVMKEKYDRTILEILEFRMEDVIMISNLDDPEEEYQVPIR